MRGLTKMSLLAMGLAAICAVPANAQSANRTVEYITVEDAEMVLRAARTQATRNEDGSFDIELVPGLMANGELQNCEDKAQALNCRTLSIVVNIGSPDGASREQVLELVNQCNRGDVYGRAFVNDRDTIVMRMSYIATGNEQLLSIVQKVLGWRAQVGRTYAVIYDL